MQTDTEQSYAGIAADRLLGTGMGVLGQPGGLDHPDRWDDARRIVDEILIALRQAAGNDAVLVSADGSIHAADGYLVADFGPGPQPDGPERLMAVGGVCTPLSAPWPIQGSLLWADPGRERKLAKISKGIADALRVRMDAREIGVPAGLTGPDGDVAAQVLAIAEAMAPTILDAHEAVSIADLFPTIKAPRGGISFAAPFFGNVEPEPPTRAVLARRKLRLWWSRRPLVRGWRQVRGRASDAVAVWAGDKVAATEDEIGGSGW